MQKLAVFAVSAAASVGAGGLLLAGYRLAAGGAALVAFLGLLLAEAGRIRKQSRARLVGLLVDRIYEFCLLVPLAWVARTAEPRLAMLSLAGLGASYLAAYQRARGAALGYRTREAPAYRAARMGLLVVGLLTGWIEAGLWVFALLTAAASVVRAANVARQARRMPARSHGA
jgi:hypothetical protein